MNKILPLLFCVLLLLSGCSSNTAKTIIEMELTDSYDDSDPFVNEKLFYVSDSIDTLELNVSFKMEGESGVLEIADNETKKVLWSNIWNENIDNTTFSISLDTVEKEKEYVIRFTGTKIKYAKIVVTSDDKLVKECVRPMKPDRD